MVGLVRVTPVGQVGDLEMQAAGDSPHLKQNYFSEKPSCLRIKPSPDCTRPTTLEVDSVQIIWASLLGVTSGLTSVLNTLGYSTWTPHGVYEVAPACSCLTDSNKHFLRVLSICPSVT